MSRFKVGQKVVCINNDFINTDIPRISVGEIVTIQSMEHLGYLKIKEYLYDRYFVLCNYEERHFEPIIESRSEFVEVSYTQIKESNPKVSAS